MGNAGQSPAPPVAIDIKYLALNPLPGAPVFHLLHSRSAWPLTRINMIFSPLPVRDPVDGDSLRPPATSARGLRRTAGSGETPVPCCPVLSCPSLSCPALQPTGVSLSSPLLATDALFYHTCPVFGVFSNPTPQSSNRCLILTLQWLAVCLSSGGCSAGPCGRSACPALRGCRGRPRHSRRTGAWRREAHGHRGVGVRPGSRRAKG